jgi:hypothetical protein
MIFDCGELPEAADAGVVNFFADADILAYIPTGQMTTVRNLWRFVS